MAGSHRGPQHCHGHPGHTAPCFGQTPAAKGSPHLPAEPGAPCPAGICLILTWQHQAKGCSAPPSQRAMREQEGNLSDLPRENLGKE